MATRSSQNKGLSVVFPKATPLSQSCRPICTVLLRVGIKGYQLAKSEVRLRNLLLYARHLRRQQEIIRDTIGVGQPVERRHDAESGTIQTM